MRHGRLVLISLLALGAVALLATFSAVADPGNTNNAPTYDWFFDSGGDVTIADKTWDIKYNITVANDTHPKTAARVIRTANRSNVLMPSRSPRVDSEAQPDPENPLIEVTPQEFPGGLRLDPES